MSNVIGSSRESNPSRGICHLRAVPLGHVISMQQNKKKTDWQLTKLFVFIGKFYCGFLILHLAFRLLVAEMV